MLTKFKDFILNNMVFVLYGFCLFILMFFTELRSGWIICAISIFGLMVNNAFQIFGTLIIANKNEKIWKPFLFLTTIFCIAILYAWFFHGQELHFNKLENINYTSNFDIFNFIAPIIIIYLTYKKIPVSSTFLLLSLFTSKFVFQSMIERTIESYLIAFITGFCYWNFLEKKLKDTLSKKQIFEKIKNSEKFWLSTQYASTGLLFISWIMSNTSNMVVVLPRNFSIFDLIILMFFGIITIFYILSKNGGKMQQILVEKRDINNIQSTSILNIIYSLIIYLFQFITTTPISTTWVFIGLIAGRELAIINRNKMIMGFSYRNSVRKITKDFLIGFIGVVVSLLFLQITLVFRNVL